MRESVGFQSAGGIASAQSELQKYGGRSDRLQAGTDRHLSSSGAVLMMILAGVDKGHGPE